MPVFQPSSNHADHANLATLLPPDDALRVTLHDEVHARPSALVTLPSLIIYVAVLNEGVSRDQELEHLRQLPGQQALGADQMNGNFLRLSLPGHTVKWERHTEFTRYSMIQPMPADAMLGALKPALLGAPAVSAEWLRGIPGHTVVAIALAMVHGDLANSAELLRKAQTWFGERTMLASQLGNGHSWALTDFRLAADGFEKMLVIAPPGTTVTRAGRISQRLLEVETYRLMALRGLPVAKALGPMLNSAENSLADITAQLENKSGTDQELLDQLVALATRVERAIAEHSFRFSATRAYNTLVGQRIAELREKAIPGTQTIGEFMQRRLSPAIATVAASNERLASLSERVSRTSALLRTRVDIATEAQNQQLLEKLTRGQELQLRLQSTVEGLSIMAISYYAISLLLYAGKGLHAAGVPINAEIATGALIPLVLWGVWRTTRRIQQKLHH